jgi:hypothetical protein
VQSQVLNTNEVLWDEQPIQSVKGF